MNFPIRLDGLWDEGVALDLYTLSSEYVGDDAFGHPRFNNTYSYVGDLLYHYKYNGHQDKHNEIAEYIAKFLGEWLWDKNIDVIMPCPASLARNVQPVYAIVYRLAELMDIPYTDKVLCKTVQTAVKNTPKAERTVRGTIRKRLNANRKCSILLVDDIFETGATANECVRLLKEDPNIEKVYFLAIAKKRK